MGELTLKVSQDSLSYNATIKMLKALERALFDHLGKTNAALQNAKAKLKMLRANVTQTSDVVHQFAQNNPCYSSCLDNMTTGRVTYEKYSPAHK